MVDLLCSGANNNLLQGWCPGYTSGIFTPTSYLQGCITTIVTKLADLQPGSGSFCRNRANDGDNGALSCPNDVSQAARCLARQVRSSINHSMFLKTTAVHLIKSSCPWRGCVDFSHLSKKKKEKKIIGKCNCYRFINFKCDFLHDKTCTGWI